MLRFAVTFEHEKKATFGAKSRKAFPDNMTPVLTTEYFPAVSFRDALEKAESYLVGNGRIVAIEERL